jgi:hypothetical protein
MLAPINDLTFVAGMPPVPVVVVALELPTLPPAPVDVLAAVVVPTLVAVAVAVVDEESRGAVADEPHAASIMISETTAPSAIPVMAMCFIFAPWISVESKGTSRRSSTSTTTLGSC